MRTTVTLDPDVEALLRRTVRERGEPFKVVLNDALRGGLCRRRPAPVALFRQRTFDMGRPQLDLTRLWRLPTRWRPDLDCQAPRSAAVKLPDANARARQFGEPGA